MESKDRSSEKHTSYFNVFPEGAWVKGSHTSSWMELMCSLYHNSKLSGRLGTPNLREEKWASSF